MRYKELAEILRKNIDKGVYQETGKLPTEDNLMEEYQVTRYCVRNAINILVELGQVYPVQGSGMFTRTSKRKGCLSLGTTKGVTGELEDSKVETKVIRLESMQADQEWAERMKCAIGTPIYHVIRVRYVDGEPLSVEDTYYNKEMVSYLDEKIAAGSIFHYIKSSLGLNIGFADKIVYADKLTKEVAKHLELEAGDPAIVIEDDVYLTNGKMFNASHVYYHYKRAKFFNLASAK
jgi:GntR family transcriptional regulator of bglA